MFFTQPVCSRRFGVVIPRRAHWLCLIAPVLCVLLAPAAHGSSYTWNVSGSGGGSWSTAGNWTATSGPPGSTTATNNSDTATFTSVGSGVITVDTHRNLENITFAASAGAFTLSSGTLYMTSSGEIQTTGAGANSENINSAVVLEGNYTFSSGYTNSADALNFGGAISSAGGAVTLTLAGSNTGTNTINGGISNGSGSNSVAISVTGANWTIAGTNSYSGGTTVSGGTLTLGGTNSSAGGVVVSSSGQLNVNSNGALGSGTLEIASGATIDSTVSGVSVSTAPPIKVDGSFTFGGTNSLNLGTGSVTFSSSTPTVTLNGNGSTLTVGSPVFPSANGSGKSETLTVTDDGTGDTFAMNGLELHLGNQAGTTILTGNGNIAVAGTITPGHSGDALSFTGTGTLTVSATTSYTGATSDLGAVFVMNGTQSSASAVTVGGTGSANNSPTLGGTGTILGAVSVSAKSTNIVSIINPGVASGTNGAAGTATLTLSGGVTFGTSSDYKVNISGANADELLVSGGNLTIGTTDTLTFNTLVAPTAGDYVLASVSGSGDTLSGTFSASGTPTGYTLVYTSTALNLEHTAVLSIAPTATNYNARVSTSTTVGVTVSDTAPSGGVSLTYGLTGNVTGSSLGPLTAGGAGSTTTASYSVPSTAGVNNLSVTGTDANNSGDTATANFTVTGYNYANPTYTNTLAIGNVRVGAATTRSVTNTSLGNTTYQDGLNVTATNGGNSDLTVGNPSEIAAGSSGNITYTANAAGSLAATSAIGLVSNANGVSGLSNLTLTSGSIAITGAAYNYASPTYNGTVTIGNVRVGTATNQSVTNASLGNTSFQDGLNVTATTGIAGLNVTNPGEIAAGGSGNVTYTAGSAGSLAGTATLGLVSNDNNVSGLSNQTLASGTITLTGAAYNYASPTYNGTLAVGNVRVGAVTNASVTNTALGNTSFQDGLNVTANNGGNSDLTVGNPGEITAGTSGNITYTASSAGSLAATSAIGLVSNANGVSGLSNLTLTSGSIAITGAAYNYASPTYSSTLAIGNVRVGAVTNASITNTSLGNTTFQDGLNVTATNGGNSDLTVGNPGEIAAGTSGNITYTASSAGSLATTSTLGLVSNANGVSGLSNQTLTSGSIAVTGAAYNYASPTQNTMGTVNLGVVHEGAASPTGLVSITNTALGNTSYQDSLDASATSNNASVTGNSTNILAGNTGSLTLTASTATAGSLASTVTIGFTSNANGVSGLSNTTLASGSVNTTGYVYSGAGVWNTNGGGSWGTSQTSSQASTDWQLNGGTPGITTGYTTSDSATFGSAATSGTATVTLDGASPYLNAITFNDSAASYDIEKGSSGMIHLSAAGTNTATVTVLAGSHTIGAPIELDSNASTTVASGDTLTISGIISQGSDPGMTVNGPGTTVLSNADTYSGGTTVASGTLVLSNTSGSATGTGSVTVNGGATLGGYGSSSGTGFSIAGTGTGSGQRANVLVGMNSATDSNTAQTLSLIGSASSTITNANLTFNINDQVKGGLGTDPAGSGTELNVGSTAITFAGGAQSTTLTLNIENIGVIDAYTPYVLIAGNTVGGVDQYTGLSLGNSTGDLSTGLITQIMNSGVGQSGDLTLALTGMADTWYGGPSYLFLYQNSTSGADDIEVEIVPEPGTWGMIFSGLAILFFWQRLRRQQPPNPGRQRIDRSGKWPN
jgi:hypothetical protein